jgi:phosphoglycolate phosphatase-like HAD superfamily hydrolase
VARVLLVAFDVDGTLIDVTGAGGRAMETAFVELLSLSTRPRISFAGRTDRAIVRDGLESLGVGAAPSETDIQRLFERYLSRLPDEIARTPYSPTPGAAELLASLRRCPATKVGIATGNLERATRLKLQSAGFAWRFDFCAFGDTATSRTELLSHAFESIERELAPRSTPRRVVVGDTPSDVDAAHQVGAVAVAVATGPYSLECLRGHEPHLAIATLEEALDEGLWRAMLEFGAS